MARVNFVKSAKPRKNNRGLRRCYACHEEIQLGESYKWFALKAGRSSLRRDYHSRCAIKPSHQTTSAQLGTIYDAQEEAQTALSNASTFEEIEDALSSAADSIQEASDMYRESAENIESGFGHATYVSDELNEKADNVEQWADEIRDSINDIEEWDEDEARSQAEGEVDEALDNEDADESEREEWIESRIEELRDEWLSDAINTAESALDNSPL